MTNNLWLATMSDYDSVYKIAEETGFIRPYGIDGNHSFYAHPILPSDVKIELKNANDCHLTVATYLKFYFSQDNDLRDDPCFRDLLKELKVHMPDLMVKEEKNQDFLISVDDYLLHL